MILCIAIVIVAAFVIPDLLKTLYGLLQGALFVALVLLLGPGLLLCCFSQEPVWKEFFILLGLILVSQIALGIGHMLLFRTTGGSKSRLPRA